VSSSHPASNRDNDQWVADLRPGSAARDAAVRDLRDYLLRAILVYLIRHRSDLSVFDYDELRQFAEDWAQQALLQVLDNLPSFRGDSRFTTWAYRIAINLAAAELRRKRWENLSLEGMTESDAPDLALRQDTSTPSLETQVTREQVWAEIESIIETELTDRQRTALTRIVLQGVPVEVVAEELDTNRNNLYKILHDARRRLRRSLESRGWSADDVLRPFESNGHE
jgi:RNA polymerase sigma-70 factor (ECF subfamily)